MIAGTGIPGGKANHGVDVRVVSSNDDHHHIYLTEALSYEHFSEMIEIEGRVVDLRCEVGLLTRNIVIQVSSINSVGTVPPHGP